MSDVVVTVPINFTHPCAPGLKGLAAWIAEGDAAGDEWSDTVWGFTTGGARPNIKIGERVYVICEDRLRGYAPLALLHRVGRRVTFVRKGDAVAVTIPERITGFQGWRYRWWDRADEAPFPNWKTADLRHRARQVT